MKGIGWYKKAIEKLDVSYNIGEINSEISNLLSEYFIDEKKLIHLLKQKDIIIHVAEKQNSVLLSIFKNAYTCILKAKVRDHIKRGQKNPDQITTRLRENYEIPEKFKKFFKIRKDYQSSFKKYLKENIKKKMLSYHKLMQQAEGAIFIKAESSFS